MKIYTLHSGKHNLRSRYSNDKDTNIEGVYKGFESLNPNLKKSLYQKIIFGVAIFSRGSAILK